MLRALYTAASGMRVQQTNVDVIANNLANVNTSGYKRTQADFQDLLSRVPGNANALVIINVDKVHARAGYSRNARLQEESRRTITRGVPSTPRHRQAASHGPKRGKQGA